MDSRLVGICILSLYPALLGPSREMQGVCAQQGIKSMSRSPRRRVRRYGATLRAAVALALRTHGGHAGTG